MAKTWVLDTETKGTGAQMVPIEKVHGGPAKGGRSAIVVQDPKPRPERPPEPKGPRRFKGDGGRGAGRAREARPCSGIVDVSSLSALRMASSLC